MTATTRDLRPSPLLVVLLLLSILIGAVGTAIGVYGLSLATDAGDTAATAQEAADNAQKALDELQSSRDENRVASCNNANTIAKKHNALTQGVEDTLTIVVTGNGTRTPTDEAKALLAQEIAKYEAIKIEIRDCSLAGIEKFTAENKEAS